MKKTLRTLSLMLALLMMAGFTLTGCGNDQDTYQDDPATIPPIEDHDHNGMDMDTDDTQEDTW